MASEEIKQKIIFVTIECIENDGYENVTIRKIAEKAGVNVAAVNYHFGSKEQLLKLAMLATLNESFVNNINDYEELWQDDTKQALRLFLIETLKGAISYPNITKSHFASIFSKNDYSTDSIKLFTDFMGKFHELIKPILKQNDEKSKFSTAQLFSTILLAGMMPDLFGEFSKLDLKKTENQLKFIEVLLENFIK